MLCRKFFYLSVLLGSCLGTGLGQQAASGAEKRSASPPTMLIAQAFPLIMEENVVAGKTPVGAKIQAKLVIATLVSGMVIPQDAVFSGEVIESKAKTPSGPSRLAVRLDTAKWKNGSLAIHAYLTQWYYPVTFDSGSNPQYGAEQSASKGWNGMGRYPDPNSPAYKPFPPTPGVDDTPSASSPSSTTSDHPVQMKDVEFERNSAGAITLISNHTNLKLDKQTTYVFSSSGSSNRVK
jgi:hypothetical protein